MPILGVIASSKLTAVDSDFESISTHAVTSATTSITFSSIPGTYKHLQIRGILLSSSANPEPRLRINGSSTAGAYNSNYMYATGTGVASPGTDNNSGNVVLGANRGNSTYPSPFLIYLTDYTSSGKWKTGYVLHGLALNTTDRIIYQTAFSFESTSAVTSIEISMGAGNINANSHFALYGINS